MELTQIGLKICNNTLLLLVMTLVLWSLCKIQMEAVL